LCERWSERGSPAASATGAAGQQPEAKGDPEQDRIPVDTPRVGKLPDPLDPKDERALLAELNKTADLWTVKESRDKYAQGGFRRELHRLYEFETFDAAFQFMKDVTERAIIPYNHHPGRTRSIVSRCG
jgi:pterin-4a-carbinolamine dehydratase